MKQYILCFLCLIPDPKLLDFINCLKNEQYDIYICIDDNRYIPNKNRWKNINFIQINNDECRNSGYKSLVAYFNEQSCSKDKALYYFNNINIKYNYIWFIEDDAFIPTVNTIKNIDNKYNNNIDFLTPTVSWGENNSAFYNFYWYPLIELQFYWLKKKTKIDYFDVKNKDIPRWKTMTCACRLSKKFMDKISIFVNKYGTLFMDEVFYIYIAKYNQLNIKEIPELNNQRVGNDFIYTDININNIYHPIKCFTNQHLYRNKLKDL